jgi:hypothetical protein
MKLAGGGLKRAVGAEEWAAALGRKTDFRAMSPRQKERAAIIRHETVNALRTTLRVSNLQLDAQCPQA